MSWDFLRLNYKMLLKVKVTMSRHNTEFMMQEQESSENFWLICSEIQNGPKDSSVHPGLITAVCTQSNNCCVYPV